MQERQEAQVQPLGQEDPLEKSMATHSSILAWRIPWTEEPGGLQSMGSQSWTQLSAWAHACTHTTHTYIHTHIILKGIAFWRKFPTISSCLGKETTSLFSNWKTLLNLFTSWFRGKLLTQWSVYHFRRDLSTFYLHIIPGPPMRESRPGSFVDKEASIWMTILEFGSVIKSEIQPDISLFAQAMVFCHWVLCFGQHT